MARPGHGLPDLRGDVPTLEPDEAFLARLSELAAGSGASRPPAGAPSLTGWRVGLAAACTAAVVGGVAVLAAVIGGDEVPTPPVTPATHPTDPDPNGTDTDVPTGRSDSDAGHDGTTEQGGSAETGGATGGSVGSAPGGGSGSDAGDHDQDDPGEDAGQGSQNLDPDNQGSQDNQGNQGQDGQPHGQDEQDHGQDDGVGDEVEGLDGQPHGLAGQSQGSSRNGGDRAMGER